MQINTKYSIGDQVFHFQYDAGGNLMSIVPFTIRSISIEKDSILYYSSQHVRCSKEEALFTASEAIEKFKSLYV